MSRSTKPTVAVPFRSSAEPNTTIPAIRSWRPFEFKDLDGIRNLIRPITEELFGPDVCMEDTIEFSSHRLVMLNTNNEIISCFCLREYPNIVSILPESWPQVLKRHYNLNSMTPENTLFVHLFVWDLRYDWNVLIYYMKSLYLCMFRLQYIVFVALPGTPYDKHVTDHLLMKHFHKIIPITCKPKKMASNCQTLYVTNRSSIVPKVVARYATPEDNDDIIEMLDEDEPRLRKIYGEYFIANMLLNENNYRKIIVLESNNSPMGILCLNDHISYVNLTINFEIGIYRNFCKMFCDTEYTYSVDSDLDKLSKDNDYDRLRSELIAINGSLSNVTVFSTSPSASFSLSVDDSTSSLSPSTLSYITDTSDFRETLKSRAWRTTVHYADTAITDDSIRDAFLIELQSIHKDFDERFVVDILGAAFQAYPTYTYALISIPTTRHYIPLLSHFVRVIPRPRNQQSCSRAVYALHRNALHSDISVRTATLNDKEDIQQFLRRMHDSAYHIQEILETIELQSIEEGLHVFVTIVEEKIVGICILRSGATDLAEYSSLYELEIYIDCKVHMRRNRACKLSFMILHPAFMNRLPTIVSEYFRLSCNSSMFYTIEDMPNYHHQLVNSMLGDMIPIMPRRLVEYDLSKMKPYHNRPPACMIPPLGSPYALYMHNNHLCTSRKLPVNTRIVIVGCGQTGMAFLERLIFGQKYARLQYASLTLCAPNGFQEFDNSELDPMASWFRSSFTYTNEYVRRLSYRTWVNVIYGTMTAINRKEKFVMLDEKRRVYYDRLYLFCGLQFDIPMRLPTPPKPLTNVMFVKNPISADHMILKIKEVAHRSHHHFIVYGGDRMSFTCLRILMLLVKDPKRIIYVRPRTYSHVGLTTLFNDTFVDNVMEKCLQQSGIKFYDGYDVIDWKVEKNQTVSHVYAENEFRVLTLQCSLFICFEVLVIPRKNIQILRQAGLVFDGRLIVNDDSQTNDPSIFACGPMTKYHVNMHANDSQQRFLCSHEVGSLMADRAMNELSPFARETKVKSLKVVHTRKLRARVRHTALPYDLHYMSVGPPGKPIAIDLARTLDTYGHDLITGEQVISADRDFDFSKVNYCRLNITETGNVHSIVSLTNYEPNTIKFTKLWNRNENTFKNLRIRYENGMIPDLNEFFMRPWIYVLIHDRYERDVQLPIIQSFYKDTQILNQITYEITDRILDNKWQGLSERERSNIVDMYFTSQCNLQVQQTFVEFIKEQADELPIMIATPDNDNVGEETK